MIFSLMCAFSFSALSIKISISTGLACKESDILFFMQCSCSSLQYLSFYSVLIQTFVFYFMVLLFSPVSLYLFHSLDCAVDLN